MPNKPGIYIFLGIDEILYVGKSRMLVKRVRSYFQRRTFKPLDEFGHIDRDIFHENRKRERLQQAEGLFFQTTQDEASALILEDYLIDQIRPPWNRTMKPVKKNFLKITSEEFPRLEHTKTVVDDGSYYVGPIKGFNRFKPILKSLQRTFRLRTCESFQPGTGKPQSLHCTNPEVARHNCLAPCYTKDAREFKERKRQYAHSVQQLLGFLSRKNRVPIVALENKREKYSKALNFERAAQVQSDLEWLEHFLKLPRLTITGPRELQELHALGKEVIAAIKEKFAGR